MRDRYDGGSVACRGWVMGAKQPDLELTAPGLHLAPSPTVHSDKEDLPLCSFVASEISHHLYFVHVSADI